jgi:hypothetical protein
MAHVLQNIILVATYEKPFATITMEEFEESFTDDLIELLTDIDTMVKLKAL